MTRALTFGAIAGPILFTAAWVILGLLSPGYTLWDIHIAPYSAVSQPISGLGLGPTGPFMNAAFVVSGLLLLAGIIGIVTSIPELDPRARWGCAALLGVSPLGCMTDGLFTLESFFPHFVGYLVAIGSTIVSFVVFGLVVRRLPRWRRMGTALIFGGPLTLVLMVAAQLTFDPLAAGANLGIAGLTERMAVTEVLAWFVAMGWTALRSDAAGSGALQAAA
jgi:hypothetical protein